jgi:hypothetical protein
MVSIVDLVNLVINVLRFSDLTEVAAVGDNPVVGDLVCGPMLGMAVRGLPLAHK